MSNAEWERRAVHIREAVESYRELDMGALAERALQEYRKGRDEGFELTPLLEKQAIEATAAMIVRTGERVSTGTKVREVIRTYASYLLPVVAVLAVSIAGRELVGWSRIPSSGLVVCYATIAVVAIGFAWARFRSEIDGPLIGLRRIYAPGLAAGMVAAAIAAPLVIEPMRTSELSLLAQANFTFERTIATYLAKEAAGTPMPNFVSGVPGLSVKMTKVGGTEPTYIFDTPGLPGSLHAEIKGSSGEIYWKTGIGKEYLQSLIEVGKLEKGTAGSFRFVRAGHEAKSVTALPEVVVTEGLAAVVLDPKGSKLMAVTPVIPPM
jgi:hypothetical protein